MRDFSRRGVIGLVAGAATARPHASRAQSAERVRRVGVLMSVEKPADLPVQAPTKYELVINLKTPKVLARANEVIE